MWGFMSLNVLSFMPFRLIRDFTLTSSLTCKLSSFRVSILTLSPYFSGDLAMISTAKNLGTNSLVWSGRRFMDLQKSPLDLLLTQPSPQL